MANGSTHPSQSTITNQNTAYKLFPSLDHLVSTIKFQKYPILENRILCSIKATIILILLCVTDIIFDYINKNAYNLNSLKYLLLAYLMYIYSTISYMEASEMRFADIYIYNLNSLIFLYPGFVLLRAYENYLKEKSAWSVVSIFYIVFFNVCNYITLSVNVDFKEWTVELLAQSVIIRLLNQGVICLLLFFFLFS